ncbi:response regulator [Rhizobium sp. KVB221]|uniref:Response regulator n=1 Tax=Rhizobium setariae TaxID=2801340 RepID=A0A937CNU6_9HYPH|nr:response regulator [Rhizobium setariae]MBL0372399.1 response regulator [Rhizobium setariae]
MPNVLIADESDAIRTIGALILTGLGFNVSESSGALDVFARCEADLPDVLVIDSALHGALDVIRNIRALPNGNAVHIFYSVAKADLRILMEAKLAGASDVLLKPFDRKVLSAVFANIAASAAA